MNIKSPYRLVSPQSERNYKSIQIDCPTIEKNSFAIRAAINKLYVIAAPHHVAIDIVTIKN